MSGTKARKARLFSRLCPCDPSAKEDGRKWCACVSYIVGTACQDGDRRLVLRALAQARSAGKFTALAAIARETRQLFSTAAHPALDELIVAAEVHDEWGSINAIGRLNGLLATPETDALLNEFADVFDADRARLVRRASRTVRDCGAVVLDALVLRGELEHNRMVARGARTN